MKLTFGKRVLAAATALLAALALDIGLGAGQAAAISPLNYTCSFPAIGNQTVTTTVTASTPTVLHSGQPSPTFATTLAATLPANFTSLLGLFGATTISASASLKVNADDPDGGTVIIIIIVVPPPPPPPPPSGAFTLQFTGTS